MARYILIDNYSGRIWGDSADLEGKIFNGTAVEFAAALDRHVDSSSASNRDYVEESRADNSSVTGYHVYRADINGSEAVPAIWDGSDRDMIEAVQRDCQYEGFIRVVSREDNDSVDS